MMQSHKNQVKSESAQPPALLRDADCYAHKKGKGWWTFLVQCLFGLIENVSGTLTFRGKASPPGKALALPLILVLLLSRLCK